MNRCLPVILLLVANSVLAQEAELELIQDKGPIEAVRTLPVLGRLSDEQKKEILRVLTDADAVKVTNIFKEVDAEQKPQSPESVYNVVISDLKDNVPEDQWVFTRYLSLYAIEPKDRYEHAIVTSFILNSLSWSHQIAWPEIVPGTNNGLLRFNITNYGRNFKDFQRWVDTWEVMSSADVYFLEPWVAKADSQAAFNMTGSIGCVLRADWFNFYAMLDDDPSTKDAVEGFYSQFLGLPSTETELLKLLSVDLKDIADKGSDRAGVVVISGEGSDAEKVGRNNRKVNRTPTILTAYGGYFYFTQDVLNSQGIRNFLNNPLSTFKDGGEYIWRLPNGLQGYYLSARAVKNGKEVFERVAEVPIQIAVDPHFEDGRVRIRSCVYCHKNGINRFVDRYAVLTAPRAPGGLVKPVVKNATQLIRLKQLFYPDTRAYVQADQMNYQQSVFLATGMSTDDFRLIYKKCLDFYEAPVTPKRAAWEFGVANGAIGLEEYLADKVVSTTQGSLLSLVKGFGIQRDTFEEEFKNGKLLQEIKQNIIPKGDRPQINLVIPSAVIGTAVSPKLDVTERVDSVTLQQPTSLIRAGSSSVIATIPANTTLKVIRSSENGGRRFVFVEYRGQEGWIRIDR